jgi:hypothetical protein
MNQFLGTIIQRAGRATRGAVAFRVVTFIKKQKQLKRAG